MSALCRGSVEDKLRIAYRMYDTDMDGHVSLADWQRQEVDWLYVKCFVCCSFVASVYALLGSIYPPVDRFHIRHHANEISRVRYYDVE